MQPIWNGDGRDRVKWGAIYHLAEKHKIREIVWVAFDRDETEPTLKTDDGIIHIPEPVWTYFSDPHRIQDLWGDGRKVHVYLARFGHETRREYISAFIAKLPNYPSPRLVFLDPDTGFEPGRASAGHVTEQDIREIWTNLNSGDMLLVYQHGARKSRETWLEQRRQQLQGACGGARVSAIRAHGRGIARDVAILWATRSAT